MAAVQGANLKKRMIHLSNEPAMTGIKELPPQRTSRFPYLRSMASRIALGIKVPPHLMSQLSSVERTAVEGAAKNLAKELKKPQEQPPKVTAESLLPREERKDILDETGMKRRAPKQTRKSFSKTIRQKERADNRKDMSSSSQLNSGVNPKVAVLAAKMVSIFIRAGIRKFAQFVKTAYKTSPEIVEKLGQEHMEGAYAYARRTDEFKSIRRELDSEDVLDNTDYDALIKEAKAEMAAENAPESPSAEAESTFR